VIKAESDYYPWGGELQFVNNDSNHYKFTGKERDAETGLDYFGARYYSNGLGRWISADWSATPIPVPYADFGDPQTLNIYSYVRNVPTTSFDPDGHGDPLINWVFGTNDPVKAAKDIGNGLRKLIHNTFELTKLATPGQRLQFQAPANQGEYTGMNLPALIPVFREGGAIGSTVNRVAGDVGTAIPSLSGAVESYEVGTYGALRARSVVGDGLTLDHIPSNASNLARAAAAKGEELTAAERAALRDQGTAVAVPENLHRSASPTYGGRNTAAEIAADAANPQAAAARDTQAMVNAASDANKAKAQAAAAKICQAASQCK
jgi:RHS repeat-associated protein